LFNKLHQKDSLWRKTAIEKEKKDDDEDKKKQATSNEPSLLAKIFCCGVTNRDKDNCDKPEQNEEEIEEKILQRVMQAKEKPDEAGYDDNFDFINNIQKNKDEIEIKLEEKEPEKQKAGGGGCLIS